MKISINKPSKVEEEIEESPRVEKESKSKTSLTLPTKVSAPLEDPARAIMLLHGEKKIGKTSLCSQFPDALFLMFEPGGKGLRIYQRRITNWRQFKEYVALIVEQDKFATIVMDTVDYAYERCLEYVCKKMNVQHPSDGDWGDVWKEIKKEFTNEIEKIYDSGRGLIMISHSEEREFEKRSGKTYTKLVPTMSKSARRVASGLADLILYYGYEGTERYLTILGSDFVEAGNRLEENFRTPDGERVVNIPMGESPTEGYQNFLTAFNNQQEETYDLVELEGTSEKPKKRKRRSNP